MHSPEVGDYIGVESCVDLTPDVVDTRPSHGGGGGMNNRRRRRDTAEKKYPPPMSCLHAESGIPHALAAHRSNGRLLLNLVPLDQICQDEEINGLDEATVNSDCYKYTGIGLNPCGGFAVAVPAF
ncbi:hypothetical protein BUALT_Bualt08G0023400 [Buddleja alternifolia]|uniref:Uncharacterized protein n=1 Tax=Buddleja alternifolia TaxID=168488 RepID=A0AAV6XB14_9LAMI|nr:hypothetical protein BUALT_Bualt08G0023400 [Buddleja alternifolia]